MIVLEPSWAGSLNDWLNLKPVTKLFTGPGSAFLISASNFLMMLFLNSEERPLTMGDSTLPARPLMLTLRLE